MCWVIPPNSPADDVGLADRVQELGLAVVDVAHDGDDRRTRHERGLVDLLLGLGVELFLDPDDLGLVPELGGDQLDRVVGERRASPSTISPAMNRIFTMSAGDLPELLGDRLRASRRGRTASRAARASRAAATGDGRGGSAPPRRAGAGAGRRGGRRRRRGGTGSCRDVGTAFTTGFAAAAFLGLRGAGGGSSTSRRLGVAAVALPPLARSRGIRSSGTLDEADRPVAPICSRVATRSLLVTPSSFASS